MGAAAAGEPEQVPRRLTGRLRLERGAGHWLLWPEGAVRPEPAWFDALDDPAAAGNPARMGRGATHTFVARGRRMLLRHYRRGGMARHIAADRYVWLGLARTRPRRELAILAHLAASGMAVPTPVGARLLRSPLGVVYRGDLIMGYIDDTRTMSSLLADGDLASAHWQRIGEAIAQFHRAGVDHADLNAHNILIDTGGRVYVIDFDRARLRRPGRWRERNLARLRRSLDKLAAGATRNSVDAGWQRLLAGYRGA